MTTLDLLATYKRALGTARYCTRHAPERIGFWRRTAAYWAGQLAAELTWQAASQPVPQPAYVKQARYYRTRARTLSR